MMGTVIYSEPVPIYDESKTNSHREIKGSRLDIDTWPDHSGIKPTGELSHWESMPWLTAPGFGTPLEAGTQLEKVVGP
jgi:hypothetical protein